MKVTKCEMFPLTVHGLTSAEFVQRWRAFQSAFAELRVTDPQPSRPDRMDFSGALLAVKAGHRILRDQWKGHPGAFVVLQNGYPDGIALNENSAEATGFPVGLECRFEPYLMMCVGVRPVYEREHGVIKAFSRLVPVLRPWHPSGDDVLASDWFAADLLPRDEPDEPVITSFSEPKRP